MLKLGQKEHLSRLVLVAHKTNTIAAMQVIKLGLITLARTPSNALVALEKVKTRGINPGKSL